MITNERREELKGVTGFVARSTCTRCNGSGTGPKWFGGYDCQTCRGRRTLETVLTLEELRSFIVGLDNHLLVIQETSEHDFPIDEKDITRFP